VRVQTWGDAAGKPLFYWHGGGGGSEEAPVLAPPLVAAGYTLFAVDAPGYGRSPALEPEGYAAPRLAELAAGLLEALGIAPAVWIGFSWGASMGVHTAARFPSAVRALALLDGGYLVAEDDPDYDRETDYEDELAELRRSAEEGESWDAPPEVIGAAMVASRLAPCPPSTRLSERVGFPSCSFTRRSRPNCGESANGHSTGSAPDSPRRASCRSRTRRTASSRTTRER